MTLPSVAPVTLPGSLEALVPDPTTSIDGDSRRNLVRLLRAAYPHPRFPDGPYERTADAVIGQAADDLWQRLALTEGLAGLDARAATVSGGKGFADLDEGAALDLLRGIADAEFFKLIRSVAVVSLYDDPEVHELLGYGGPSFEQGGYLHRGFDDLDWLPTPRVEEYDGPEALVEVAPDDEPANASNQA